MFQTHDAWEWVFVAAPILVLAEVLVMIRLRRRQVRWDEALIFGARGSLAVAFVGFVWDVAWHADLGRDSLLFTVPHVLILMGLAGLGLSALAAILLAREPIGLRVWRFNAPYSAVALGALATGALIGFPLDDLWHRTYGIDVTMWSPTHLLMIGGASLAPLALWLAMAERRLGAPSPFDRVAAFTIGGIVLVGLSTFQLEYDVGVEQWQLLLQPMLIAGAAAIALVAARAAGGRGAALTAVAAFWVIRGVIDLLLAGLQRDIPRIPLYVGEAVAIEAAFLLLPRLRPAVLGLVAGGAAALLGIATEWPWTHLWYALPWQPSLAPYLWEAVAVGVAGGVVGMGIGSLAARRPGPRTVEVIACLGVIAALFLLHVLFRHADPATATVRTSGAGNGGVSVDVSLSPQSAAAGADFLDVVAWQGGAVHHYHLQQAGPGHYATAGPVPVLGRWKSLVLLGRDDVFEAVPVAFPADPVYGLPAIPPPAERQERFVPASQLLMREAHGGTPVPATLAMIAFLFFVIAWPIVLGLAFRFVAQERRLHLAELSPVRWRLAARSRPAPRPTPPPASAAPGADGEDRPPARRRRRRPSAS